MRISARTSESRSSPEALIPLCYAQTGIFDGGNTLRVGKKQKIEEFVALRRNTCVVLNAYCLVTAACGYGCGTQIFLIRACRGKGGCWR